MSNQVHHGILTLLVVYLRGMRSNAMQTQGCKLGCMCGLADLPLAFRHEPVLYKLHTTLHQSIFNYSGYADA